MKTNAARLLDALGISYELRDYEVNPEDLSAESVAHKIGLPLEQTFKTLVVRGDRTGVLFAVVPGDARGTQILLAPGDYLRALGGRAAVGPIGRSKDRLLP